MKKLLLYHCFLLSVLVLLLSCTKNKTIVLPLTTLEIKVKYGNSWNPSNTTMTIASSAVIKIYDSQSDVLNNRLPKYITATNYLGLAAIPVDYKSRYFFTVQKDKAKNIINGLLVADVFQSQEEIDASPKQVPVPTIGSPKFLDADGDGAITSPSDYMCADYIDVIKNGTATKTVIIYQ